MRTVNSANNNKIRIGLSLSVLSDDEHWQPRRRHDPGPVGLDASMQAFQNVTEYQQSVQCENYS